MTGATRRWRLRSTSGWGFELARAGSMATVGVGDWGQSWRIGPGLVFTRLFRKQKQATSLIKVSQNAASIGTQTINIHSPLMVSPGHAHQKSASLSAAARELLLEASKDHQGAVIRMDLHEGFSVGTNGRQFVEQGDLRSAAQRRAAVTELKKARLLEDRAGVGQVFFVSAEGYRIADFLTSRLGRRRRAPHRV